MINQRIHVIGAGLAGCEAAWQIAIRGGHVRLYEMKPEKRTPAHHMDYYAELVCSNSLRSNQLENAVGLLKEELRRMGSLLITCADKHQVPAGGALAVDRIGFSQCVTAQIQNHPGIEIVEEEVTEIPAQDMTIIATGPLTTEALSQEIASRIGADSLFFFDAAAPIVKKESINMGKAFLASRYHRGTADYINCPMNREEYEAFYHALVKAEGVEIKDFERKNVFEGCMPVEIMASRGIDTLRFGPLKPVGLTDPNTGSEPYAVVQLRQDNKEGTLYNLVGFQTHLKWGEQNRVFRMIPGLENAEFVRYGVMHRNTFIDSPKLLHPTYRLRENDRIYFAGQITGVEGYVESIASGMVAGINAFRAVCGLSEVVFPPSTAIGALSGYIASSAKGHFQPMNINYGIMEGLGQKIRRKKEKGAKIAERALDTIKNFQDK